MSKRICYIDLEEAFQKLIEVSKPKPIPESVPVSDAYKRVLAEDVKSPINIPSDDRSHLDGYVVYAEDTASASPHNPVTLKLSGRIGLSEILKAALMKGEAFKIPTGGSLPQGADAIVPKESAYEEDGFVKILEPAAKGAHIVPKGSDVRKDELLLKKGSILRAQDLALLKTLKFQHIWVYRKPVVALISVGSELTDDPVEVASGKVLSTHDLVIAKLVDEAGGISRDLGIVPDDQEKIRAKIGEGLKEASIILTIGGSSVGEADLVSETVTSMGKPGMVVHGLKVQPGRVSGFGCIDGKPIILLPGLIQSTVNAFILLVYPLIRILIGLPAARQASQIVARLTKTIRYTTFPEFRHITWVKVTRSREGFNADPILGDSPMLNVLVKADGYILSPEQVRMVNEGVMVEVNLLPGLSSLNLA